MPFKQLSLLVAVKSTVLVPRVPRVGRADSTQRRLISSHISSHNLTIPQMDTSSTIQISETLPVYVISRTRTNISLVNRVSEDIFSLRDKLILTCTLKHLRVSDRSEILKSTLAFAFYGLKETVSANSRGWKH